jgi:hypothetical protein
MRTKTLLAAAAITAAGLVSSMAQSNVYSLNVVGYVNKSFQSGFFVFVSNPLNNSTNSLKNIIPNPPDNTQVWRWLVGAQDLDVANIATYSAGLQQWSPNPQINPGEGIFVVAGGDFTNTFVGEVPQGALSKSLVGNGNFEALGSLVPVGGSLTNVLAQYPATDNDQVWRWLVGAQDLDVANISTYSAGLGQWQPDANIPVGDGFFLVRAGGPVNYVRNFTVQ